MPIKVLYLPAGEKSPLPNEDREHIFLSHNEFKDWVASYVCGHCLLDFENQFGKPAETIGDWLEMGCGCEIDIEDPNKMIYWNDAM